jgi:hypothetical protein
MLGYVGERVCEVDPSNHTCAINDIPSASMVFDINNLSRSQPIASELISNQIAILQPFEGGDQRNDRKSKGFGELVVLVTRVARVLIVVRINEVNDEVAVEDEKIFYSSKGEGTLRVMFQVPTNRTIPHGNILPSKVVSYGPSETIIEKKNLNKCRVTTQGFCVWLERAACNHVKTNCVANLLHFPPCVELKALDAMFDGFWFHVI